MVAQENLDYELLVYCDASSHNHDAVAYLGTDHQSYLISLKAQVARFHS